MGSPAGQKLHDILQQAWRRRAKCLRNKKVFKTETVSNQPESQEGLGLSHSEDEVHT